MYIINVLIALDQLANTLLAGTPDETISARAFRLRNKAAAWRIANKLINELFWFQRNHTLKAYRSEVNHNGESKDYR